MFNNLRHKGNDNQNHTEIPSHPNQNGNYQENKQLTSAGEDAKKKEQHKLGVGI
jgi:hypothetical protein